MSESPRVVPVILSGGSGTRLWPMSRPECPKQLLALTADETMLQLTVRRTQDAARFDAPIVVANAHHADQVEARSEEHTSELQSLMRISYAGFCWKQKKN